MTMADRFFAATVMPSGLHVRGIADWGPWDPGRLKWRDEAFVDMLLTKNTGDRKARTPEELEAAMRETLVVSPTRTIWLHKDLVDDVRRLWEDMSANLRQVP